MIELAVFKHAPSKSLPMRQGPIQCIRNCTNCLLHQTYDDDTDVENVIAIKSYDNLVDRKKSWLTEYQTVQYHVGQIDVLRRNLEIIDADINIYILATTRVKDVKYFQQVLSYQKLPRARIETNPIRRGSSYGHCIVPVRMISCDTDSDSGDELREVSDLYNILAPLIDDVLSEDLKIALIPVVISKDHDRAVILRLGSLCIQIMQPYSITEYLKNIKALNSTDHLVRHLYHDLSHFAPRLSTHMVAVLLVYLNRPGGVTRQDLTDYMEWFKKSAMEFDLHLAYTGETDLAIDFALTVFGDYVKFDKAEQVYRVKNTKALSYYANTIIPNFAYYGIISRSILMLHNVDEKNSPMSRFSPGQSVKVMRDDVLDLSEDVAKKLDNMIPCRRPCVDIRTAIVNSFNSMMTFGKYFRVLEARARPSKGFGWLGDYDSDEEFYLSKRDDPSFKPWLLLTLRPYRLDRMNLFINIMETYLELISSNGTAEDDSAEQ